MGGIEPFTDAENYIDLLSGNGSHQAGSPAHAYHGLYTRKKGLQPTEVTEVDVSFLPINTIPGFGSHAH